MCVFRKMIVLVVLTCVYGCLMGQIKNERTHYLGGYWGVSIPSAGNFMNRASWMVPSAEYTWHAFSWFATGACVGYLSGQEKGTTSDHYEGDPVSGYTDRQLSSFLCGIPFYFSYPSGSHRFQPYVRLAGGMANTTYEITGDQINRSVVRKWSGFANVGIGCRYFFNPEHKWGLDLRCMQSWSGPSWELTDVRNNNRFELSLGILIKISR